ncbi:hypothetical protein BGZ97_000766 [Linnemannia gamsii]|uniref:Bulb-type lectin domain-containing protein n=1 Tax=Linnemannia gamsii TaxID=64522 RepID=A0A9P6R068_9FUNG|nr:hypothetical protein BGZ97_000766 [Linnemannia gamsii]
MIGKQITILLSLAFLAVVTLAAPLAKTAYINRFGEFVDLDTECSGRPCNYPKEIVPFTSEELSGPICVPTTNDQVICDSLPSNATLVSESEFDRIFPESDKPTTEARQDPIFDMIPGATPLKPLKSQLQLDLLPSPPKPPSRLKGDQHIWPRGGVTYGVSSQPKLSSQISDLRRTVRNGMELWSRSCFPEASNFFKNWVHTTNKNAEVWFYFVDGTVCDLPAAVACAFRPEQYGPRRTVYVNYKLLVKKTDEGMEYSMAHELGHLLGLAHEILGPGEDISPVWKLSDVDPNSIMHPLYDRDKYITATDCRLFKFYSENFQKIRCGFEGSTGKCKREPKARYVIETILSNVQTDSKMKNEGAYGIDQYLQDVADPNCLGSDPKKYILNNTFKNKGADFGYTRRGFFLTQCLGVQDESHPDYMYVLQSDGNFVSYNIKTKKAIWSTQSQGHGAKGSYSMFFQLDGNLAIYDAKGTAIWASGTWDGSSTRFRNKPSIWYFNKGHMLLSDSVGNAAWATYTAVAHADKRIEAKDVNQGHSSYCLDYSSKLYKCDGSENQDFSFYTDGTIRSRKSGYCMYVFRAENEVPVQFGPCNPLDNRYLWDFPAGIGTIKNRAGNMCLDNKRQNLQAGNQIQIWECYNPPVWSERWWIGDTP